MIIAGIISALCIPGILLSGFLSAYFSVLGGFGSGQDVYDQAVIEVKEELEIDNHLEPSILRSIYYNASGTTEADKNDIISTIKTYFVKSEELPRTVTLEDLASLEAAVDETQAQLSASEQELTNASEALKEAEQKLESVQSQINQLNDLLNALNRDPVKNEDLINRFLERLQSLMSERNILSAEAAEYSEMISSLANDIAELTEKLSEDITHLEEARETYANEPITVNRFLEMEEIKTVLSEDPFSYEDNLIEEIENYVLILSNYGRVDLGDITFENEIANDTQKAIVMVAVSAADYGIYATEGKCQAWVADIYQEVLGIRGYAPSAIEAGRSWSASTDWSRIQIGATVYGTSSNQYGHVGIYIGNGQVIHNLDGYVKTESLESWVKSYNGKCWGWENGQNLTGDPQYDCIGGFI